MQDPFCNERRALLRRELYIFKGSFPGETLCELALLRKEPYLDWLFCGKCSHDRQTTYDLLPHTNFRCFGAAVLTSCTAVYVLYTLKHKALLRESSVLMREFKALSDVQATLEVIIHSSFGCVQPRHLSVCSTRQIVDQKIRGVFSELHWKGVCAVAPQLYSIAVLVSEFDCGSHESKARSSAVQFK